MAGPTAQSLSSAFAAQFPDQTASPRCYRAPGRVNLIGEHTDYNLGFVLPIALELACYTASAPNKDGRLRVYSANQQERREWVLADALKERPTQHWTDYVLGVVQQWAASGKAVPALDLYVESTVPLGSGLSSSASFEVAVALALQGTEPDDRLAMARLCQRAERDYIGLPSGIMDQYAALFGSAGNAILLDCARLTHTLVPLPKLASIVAVNSQVKHSLGQSAYRERVAECAAAIAALREQGEDVDNLRSVTMTVLDNHADRMPPIPLKRARHVLTENERVQNFAAACAAHDLRRMGRLFLASHASMRDDYQISSPEIDFLVTTAMSLPGVYGARMTGGGFGGCIVALVDPAQREAFAEKIRGAYQRQYSIDPPVFDCMPSIGAGSLP